jgi:hypothetical protein
MLTAFYDQSNVWIGACYLPSIVAEHSKLKIHV